MSGHELIPDPSRLIRSLRDMGYDFTQAVADIIDNSIEAEADRIEVDFVFDGDDSWVRIADNGTGMKPADLREALRYGASRSYTEDDLGKFGLGLKTASMSQCQLLTVASRSSVVRTDITAYSWDIRHIDKTKRWEIVPVEDDDPQFDELRARLENNTGTVVMWRRLDRILGYQHPYGEAARKRAAQMTRELETHLSMVFHRFIGGEVRGKRIKIFVNSNLVRAWDPFCRSEKATKAFDAVPIPLVDDGVKGTVLLQGYIVPHLDDFSSRDAFDSAAGPQGWNQQQGFYVYRADRMIQSGGWSNLRKLDEHTKLARVAVSFKPELDEAFKVNVAKMRVQIPGPIRDQVRDITASLISRANAIYRGKAKGASVAGSVRPTVAEIRENGPDSAPPSQRTGSKASPLETPGANGDSHPGSGQASSVALLRTHQELVELLISKATAEERPYLVSLLRRLGLVD